MNKRNVFIVIGIFLCVFAGVWKFALSRNWTQRIPSGWQWDAEFIGVSTYPDESLSFPEKDQIGLYRRTIRIESEDKRPSEVVLVDRFTILDIQTGQTVWDFVYKAPVNPQTGEHTRPEYRNQYFVFPRNVQKKPYTIRSSYLKGISLTYTGEGQLEGLQVYHFSYKGRGEYTESYHGTEQYEGVQVQPGQEIKCADDQFIFEAWVEPITGEIAKVEESCFSGDYIYDINTQQAIKPVYRWAGITTSSDILTRIEHIRFEHYRLLWIEFIFPLLAFLIGILSILGGWRNPGRKMDSQLLPSLNHPSNNQQESGIGAVA